MYFSTAPGHKTKEALHPFSSIEISLFYKAFYHYRGSYARKTLMKDSRYLEIALRTILRTFEAEQENKLFYWLFFNWQITGILQSRASL